MDGDSAVWVHGVLACSNTFRRAMADAPDRWDWVRGAMVPGPLTAEDEEKQRLKKAEKEKKLKVCSKYCCHAHRCAR